MTNWADLSDEALVLRLQRAAFSYFIEYSNPDTGLVADTSNPGSPCSIAVVGFALACYPIAVRNGWMTRADAAHRTLTTLRFFAQSEQSDAPDATGYKGFYYHFIDMKSGRRVWQCELSLIDTALLIVGILCAGCYFGGDDDGGEESEIRTLADHLYCRVDWRWAQNGDGSVTQGWKPESGFLHYNWEGYNEALLLYVLGMGSPTNPLTVQAYVAWELTYQWENLLEQDVLYAGPLFTHLFPHAFIDFRGIRDRFMREKRFDYFQNTTATIAVHREYAERNPHNFKAYDRNYWGVTAGDGPSVQDLREDGQDRRSFGYMSRGVPYGPDDGTIAPWAMLATLPFAPDAALAGTRHLLDAYPQVCLGDRFSSGFNPTLNGDSGGWLSAGWYGLDQGILVAMIDCSRSGSTWKDMRGCRYIRDGLVRVGFEGGWL